MTSRSSSGGDARSGFRAERLGSEGGREGSAGSRMIEVGQFVDFIEDSVPGVPVALGQVDART